MIVGIFPPFFVVGKTDVLTESFNYYLKKQFHGFCFSERKITYLSLIVGIIFLKKK